MESNDAELRRKNSAITQQWLETLNNLQNHQINQTQNRSSLSSAYGTQQSLMNRQKHMLIRFETAYRTVCNNVDNETKYGILQTDSSFQSDDSHCSSIESVLELRKPDPEEVLLGLGFGPRRNFNYIGRIPARFLQPSKLIPHIDINKFLERYGENYADLPQSAPPSPAKHSPKLN